MITVTKKLYFTTKNRRKQIVDEPPALPAPPPPRVPRIARLMALAIKFDQLLREGVVSDMSELAQLARVTQPRMTQIMNLLHLAPDIQEELLFLDGVSTGRERIHERSLRPISALDDWRLQRELWRLLRDNTGVERP
jgi:hypothetical protein